MSENRLRYIIQCWSGQNKKSKSLASLDCHLHAVGGKVGFAVGTRVGGRLGITGASVGSGGSVGAIVFEQPQVSLKATSNCKNEHCCGEYPPIEPISSTAAQRLVPPMTGLPYTPIGIVTKSIGPQTEHG